MTRATAGALVAAALVAGLALRLVRLDVRPMHHDEANQAVKFGALLEHGEYRYDAYDHHGPTLYYLTLPAAWLRGQTTLAALDERTVRMVPALFGAGTLLLLPWLVPGPGPGLGRPALVAAAWLLALSPAMVFYSRAYIQEALFACFTLAFVLALGRLATGGQRGWAIAAGLSAGLAVATKETTAIVVPAAVLAAGLAWWSLSRAGRRLPPVSGSWLSLVSTVVGTAAAAAGLFYSSFLTSPNGILDPFRAAGTYVDRGLDPGAHVHPWGYYLSLLAWSSSGGLRWTEGLILGLAAVGAVAAWRRPSQQRSERAPNDGAPPEVVSAFWARYLMLDALLTMAVFSAIRYKTPWNLLPFHVVTIVVAGLGFAWLLSAIPWRLARAGLVAAFSVGLVHLGVQAWRASVTWAADPRNPYVYAHTVPDAVRMAAQIRDLAARHPDGLRMQVSVIAGPHEQWPLPWYLRTMPHVGYWTAVGDPVALEAPVVVATLDQAPALDQAFGDRYVSELFGLRPEVLLAVYIERGLWERALADVR